MREREDNQYAFGMDLKELQSILSREGGKIIIVENGKPVMVISPYKEYAAKPMSPRPEEEPEPEEVEESVSESLPSSDELTLDDLPL